MADYITEFEKLEAAAESVLCEAGQMCPSCGRPELYVDAAGSHTGAMRCRNCGYYKREGGLDKSIYLYKSASHSDYKDKPWYKRVHESDDMGDLSKILDPIDDDEETRKQKARDEYVRRLFSEPVDDDKVGPDDPDYDNNAAIAALLEPEEPELSQAEKDEQNKADVRRAAGEYADKLRSDMFNAPDFETILNDIKEALGSGGMSPSDIIIGRSRMPKAGDEAYSIRPVENRDDTVTANCIELTFDGIDDVEILDRVSDEMWSKVANILNDETRITLENPEKDLKGTITGTLDNGSSKSVWIRFYFAPTQTIPHIRRKPAR